MLASAAASQLCPLRLLLANCVRLSWLWLLLPNCVCLACCSPIASALAAAHQLYPYRLLLPNCVCFGCCSPIVCASAAIPCPSMIYLVPGYKDFSCMCVCVRYGSGGSVGGIRLVTCDLRSYYTLYIVCVITSRHNLGAAAEVDEIGKQPNYIVFTLALRMNAVYSWHIFQYCGLYAVTIWALYIVHSGSVKHSPLARALNILDYQSTCTVIDLPKKHVDLQLQPFRSNIHLLCTP